MPIDRSSLYPTMVLVILSAIYAVIAPAPKDHITSFSIITLTAFGAGEVVGAIIQGVRQPRIGLILPRVLNAAGGITMGYSLTEGAWWLFIPGGLLLLAGLTLLRRISSVGSAHIH